MKLSNKRIVITGGTSGIGYEMVKSLHLDNEVIVIARNTEKLKSLSLKFMGVHTYQADLSHLNDVKAVVGTILTKFDSIDVLINNAAVQYTPTLLGRTFDVEPIVHEVTVNFTSICCLITMMLPMLNHQKKAVILNINSGLALAPKTSSAIYCATKGALNIFSQSLRYQLEHTNISVQQAFLELVDTKMTTGRGGNKISAVQAAQTIIYGLKNDINEHDIGKVKLLRLLLRIAPSIALKIMKKY